MSAALQAARLDRMRMERDDIARLDARIAHAQRTRADAQAALTVAQQALEEIDAELEGLVAQRSLAAERLHNVARVRLRDVVATIPHDVLQCIFDARVFIEKPVNTTTTESLMRIPFQVSRICKRWREAALAMPNLWSHIYVCKLRPHTLQLAGLVLERSKGAPLNMHLTHDQGDQHFGELLEILAGHISRWRSLVIISQCEADWSLFKHPTPALEKLVLCHAGDPGQEPTDILPFAPRLTIFGVHGIASFSLQEETALPCLKELVWSPLHTTTMETAWIILRRAAATLTRVVLAPVKARRSPMATTVAVATPMLHFPRIRELTLASRFPNMTEALASFAVPGLTTLVLMKNVLVPDIVQFLDSVSGTVTCIDLFLHLGADESAILRILRNVTEVGFGRASMFGGAGYRVNNAFFSRLCESDALGTYSWPKLTSLVFDRCGEFDASDGPAGADLLRFIRSRTAPNLNDESTPRRLQRVVLGAKGVPTWLSAEVNRIMRTE